MNHNQSTHYKQKEIRLINSTLRDGVQGVWSGRARKEELLPIAYTLDKGGYEAIDLMAPVQFEICVKELKENPWFRAREIRDVVRSTPLCTHLRSRSLTSFDLVHDSIFNLWVERIAINGFKRAMIFDALNDMENLKKSSQRAKEAGLNVCLILFYTVSPVHTTQYYEQKAKALAELKPDSICLRDPSGLLTPEMVRELFPRLRKAIGNTPLFLKSHGNTGLAENCYIEAANHGADGFFVASEPLANGSSIPSVRSVTTALKKQGFIINIDMQRVKDEEDYFFQLAERTNRPISKPVNVKALQGTQFKHQIPGNMIAFTKNQLQEMGVSHLLPEVLEEFVAVRADMGYPVMVTPISQLVCVQAVLNVMHSERYKVIPKEVSRYVLGFYGRPAAPIAEDLLDRVSRQSEHLPKDAGDPIKEARDRYGRNLSDDDLLLHILFHQDQLEGIQFDSSSKLTDNTLDSHRFKQYLRLIEMCSSSSSRSIYIEKKDFRLIMKN